MDTDVDKALNCPVCNEKLQDPKVLPCLHSCCCRCLKKLASSGHPFRCYVCFEEFDHRCISKLPDNVWAKGIADALKIYSCTEMLIVCSSCDKEDTAIARCQNCADFLCDACLRAHRMTKVTKMHKIQAMGRGNDANDNEHLFADRVVKCSVHPSDDVRYCCVSCEEAICSECLIDMHRDHKLASIDECGNKQRAEVNNFELLNCSRKHDPNNNDNNNNKRNIYTGKALSVLQDGYQ